MNFSAILDISSFFIGMIINLLLIALICYYFKKKYENLEIAQNEQAKVLYQLLQQNSQPKVMNLNDILKESPSQSQLNDLKWHPESESDSDSDSDSDVDSVKDTQLNVSVNDIKTINLDEVDLEVLDLNETLKSDVDIKKNEKIEKIEKIDLDTKVDTDKDYSKMSIKQLKEILSVKGINPNKLKKNEMIELIEKSSTSIDEPIESIESIETIESI